MNKFVSTNTSGAATTGVCTITNDSSQGLRIRRHTNKKRRNPKLKSKFEGVDDRI